MVVLLELEQSEEIELELLLGAVHRRDGFDFRDYAASSLHRRLRRRASGSLGVLGLDRRETVAFAAGADRFAALSRDERIFRKAA